MTKKEFINHFVSKGYTQHDNELVGPETIGVKTGRKIKVVYILGHYGPKSSIEFQDTGKRTEPKNCLDYSQMIVVNGKIEHKPRELPTVEVIERTEGKEKRTCKTCKGTGLSSFVFEGKQSECHSCHGEPDYFFPDFETLVNKIMGNKGLKSAKPVKYDFKFKSSARAYYLWRIARFHGGIDVTMPMSATLAINGDPFYNELEQAADYIAKKVCGTNMAAAYRWMNALGGSVKVPDNQPSTAFSCGPVVVGNKPQEEMLEMI